MLRDDFLLRQVRAFAQLVARLLGREVPGEEVEAACAGLVGLDLDVAEQLPPDVLVALLTTADGLDAERCLALGLGLAARARAARLGGQHARSERLRTTAGTLVACALAARPALDEPGLHALLQELAAEA